MNFLIYIGIFLAAFLSLLLFTKRSREAHDYLLVSWLAINALHLFFYYYDFNYQNQRYEELKIAGALLTYLSAPLLYLYVCSLVLPQKFRLRKYWYHALPFLIVLGSMYYYEWFVDPNMLGVAKGFIQTDGRTVFYVAYYGLVLAFFSFLYPMLSLYLLFKHKNRIKNEFSSIEQINMNWLRYWIILSIIGFWISFIIIWAGSFRWIDFVTSFQTVASLITVNIAVIGFYGLKQTTIFSTPQFGPSATPSATNSSKYKSSTMSNDESKQYLARLQLHMKKQKPYLSSQLSLEMLAGQLGMTKHDLSQLINEQLEVNFFTFINQYRVDEFKERLKDPAFENFTLLGIAIETGFNSKSSFNQIFKNLEGLTPSQYKKQIARQ